MTTVSNIKLCDTIIAEIDALSGNKNLSERDREILREERLKTLKTKEELIARQDPTTHAYGMGDNTLAEIGDYMGITRERVRQIESSAIKKLKHPKVGRKLRNYLDE